MTASKRDANEAGIVAALRARGCVVVQMDRRAGYDLVVITPDGTSHQVEIKNSQTRWRLTDAEKKRKAEILAVGGCYHIVTNAEEAERI